jgi:zinc transport system ATP-binding protein
VTAQPAASTPDASVDAIVVDDVSVVLNGRPVLDDVSVQVAAGEVVAILGANGSGKSTLVRGIVGLVPLARGQIRLFGQPSGTFRAWHRIGYVPQRITATSGVPATVREVVSAGRLGRAAWWRPWSTADRAAIDQAVTVVGLSDRLDDGVANLSGGQQQRVLIARALAGQPDLLILDEPTAGVDAASQLAFAHTLGRLVNVGTTILLVAHELGPLEPLVQRAVVLRAGRVVHDGQPPRPVGQHADPAHDHVHPHAELETDTRWFG